MLGDNFEALYKSVFNDDGTIKACGRDACKHLITVARHMMPGVDFGDVRTGFVNIANMNRLYMSCVNFDEAS